MRQVMAGSQLKSSQSAQFDVDRQERIRHLSPRRENSAEKVHAFLAVQKDRLTYHAREVSCEATAPDQLPQDPLAERCSRKPRA